jgi:hypothetical protein
MPVGLPQQEPRPDGALPASGRYRGPGGARPRERHVLHLRAGCAREIRAGWRGAAGRRAALARRVICDAPGSGPGSSWKAGVATALTLCEGDEGSALSELGAASLRRQPCAPPGSAASTIATSSAVILPSSRSLLLRPAMSRARMVTLWDAGWPRKTL